MIGQKAILVLIGAFLIYKFNQRNPKPSGPIVKTDGGDVQGVTSISRDGREYLEYLGIRYAKAPVGSLRFEVCEINNLFPT